MKKNDYPIKSYFLRCPFPERGNCYPHVCTYTHTHTHTCNIPLKSYFYGMPISWKGESAISMYATYTNRYHWNQFFYGMPISWKGKLLSQCMHAYTYTYRQYTIEIIFLWNAHFLKGEIAISMYCMHTHTHIGNIQLKSYFYGMPISWKRKLLSQCIACIHIHI